MMKLTISTFNYILDIKSFSFKITCWYVVFTFKNKFVLSFMSCDASNFILKLSNSIKPKTNPIMNARILANLFEPRHEFQVVDTRHGGYYYPNVSNQDEGSQPTSTTTHHRLFFPEEQYIDLQREPRKSTMLAWRDRGGPGGSNKACVNTNKASLHRQQGW